MLIEPTVTTIKWTDLLPVLTPITLVAIIWKARGILDELKHKAEDIHLQTTNHIPTLLTSIDKSLSILVDRDK